jgi:F420-non-reducing hydrogenase large subunit
MATPLAQKEFDRFYTTFGSTRKNGRYAPVHHRLATHWARLIEMLYAAERMLELATDSEITSTDCRAIPDPRNFKGFGIGSVEAPRGTLTHHYTTDRRGVIKKVNLVVGTTNNYAPISMSIKRVAQQLIKKGTIIENGLLNRIEMAFRLYDPCFSCATHAIGTAPLQVAIRDVDGTMIRTISRR